MRKVLIYTGLIIIGAGILWPWISRIPIGRFPGDIIINRPGVRIFIPITTMVLLSVLLSLILWLIRR
ncbi:MAG TPA: DUF2905 domain-containing protein [Candidatus Krumholzibacteriaceae bacterium]|nr:DUF2905 domain-containing protein [Candidatus Krumholzibacteriaceae bacterium]